MMNEPNSSVVKPLYRGTQIVWYIVYVVEALLFFRFLLKFIGANPAAGFTQFVYGLTYVFAEPFLNVVPAVKIGTNVFEWTTLLAMLVYWLVAWGIIQLLVMGKPVSHVEAESKLDNQQS
jgi:YGGT family